MNNLDGKENTNSPPIREIEHDLSAQNGSSTQLQEMIYFPYGEEATQSPKCEASINASPQYEVGQDSTVEDGSKKQLSPMTQPFDDGEAVKDEKNSEEVMLEKYYNDYIENNTIIRDGVAYFKERTDLEDKEKCSMEKGYPEDFKEPMAIFLDDIQEIVDREGYPDTPTVDRAQSSTVPENSSDGKCVDENNPPQPMIIHFSEEQRRQIISNEEYKKGLYDISNMPVTSSENILSQNLNYSMFFDKSVFKLEYPENDTGLARRYLDATSRDIVYDVINGVFRCWNGRYWSILTEKELQKDIMLFSTQYYDHSRGTAYEAEALRSGNIHVIKAIINAIKAIKGKNQDSFNTAKNCLCLKNGIYSFENETLLPHALYKECLITSIIDINYVHGYRDPTFDYFINSIMLDEENAKCLQRIYGYPLLGDPVEQLAFFLLGSGANGKTTLNNAVQNVVGELSTVIGIEYFSSSLKSNPDAPSPSTYQLKEKLYAFTSEGKAGMSLNDATVKKNIGGGKLTGRKLRSDFVTFDSKFVLFFDTNHLPHFSEGGYSMQRRIVVIPFPATFTGSSLNKNMNKQLESENCKQALLAWLIEGAISYKKYGLQLTERIKTETVRYFAEEDSICAFFNDVIEDDPNGIIAIKVLYDSYRTYCEQNLIEPKVKDTFCKHEALKKYIPFRTGKIRSRKGLKFKDSFTP